MLHKAVREYVVTALDFEKVNELMQSAVGAECVRAIARVAAVMWDDDSLVSPDRAHAVLAFLSRLLFCLMREQSQKVAEPVLSCLEVVLLAFRLGWEWFRDSLNC